MNAYYTETTLSDCWFEGRVLVSSIDTAEVIQAWLCYDPKPHGNIEDKDARIIRIPVDVAKVGEAELEHLREQALAAAYGVDF